MSSQTTVTTAASRRAGTPPDGGGPDETTRTAAAARATTAAHATWRRRAGVAGVAYLAVAVLGGLAELVVRARVHVAGDAAATAAAYAEHATLVRWGVVADLVMAVAFAVLAMALYVLLRHVDELLARAMVVLVAIAVAIIALNLVFQVGAVLVATDPAYTALGDGSQASLVLLLSDLQYHGYLVAGIFFGLWLVPLGLLVRHSGAFPRGLGVLLVVGCVGYVTEALTIIAAPGLGEAIDEVAVAPAALAELWLLATLLGMATGAIRVRRGRAAAGRVRRSRTAAGHTSAG